MKYYFPVNNDFSSFPTSLTFGEIKIKVLWRNRNNVDAQDGLIEQDGVAATQAVFWEG